MTQKYFLQAVNQGFIGNSPVFWHYTDSGYTQWLCEAKQMTYEETERIMRSTHGTHSWRRWSIQELLEISKLTVDIQDMRSIDMQPSSIIQHAMSQS